MPFEPIPFTSLDLSVDKASLAASYGQMQQDIYFKQYVSPDGPKFIACKRPGLTAWSDTTQTDDIWDIFYAQRGDRIMAVLYNTGGNHKVYEINPSNGTATNITAGDPLTGNYRPSFVEGATGDIIYIANGKTIIYYTISTTASTVMADADCPTEVNSIGILNNCLLAARATSKRFDWSDAGALTTWSGEYANTESSPGYISRMMVADNYIYFFKTDGLEVWRDDGATFVRESQGIQKIGVNRHASIKYINGSFYFLDNNMDVRRMTGMGRPETISNPTLAGYISTITDFSKVQGEHLKWDGKDFYLMQFWGSSSNVPTLVYDIELNQWYKWGYYNSTTPAYERWQISGICTDDSGNWYAGDYNIGKVHKITGTQDLTTDIRSMIRTDFIDRGVPDTYKYCHEIVLIFKKADTSAAAKTMTIRYRDEGSQTWSTALTGSIEQASTTELRVHFRRLGRYKRRMWEFVFPDATQAALLSAHERFTVGS